MKTLIKMTDLIKQGPIEVQESYNQTMTSPGETIDHLLEVPPALISLAGKGAVITTHGDGSHGIEIDGELWAHPSGDGSYGGFRGTVKSLNKDVWNYINVALDGPEFYAA